MKGIGEIIQEQNIILATTDPVAKGGFTQVPNFILKDGALSLGAKVTYAMFLSYAWQNDSCFPGQERLALDMGMSRSRVTEFIGELEKSGLIGIERRGLGKTNIYTIHFKVDGTIRRPDVGRPTSRGRRVDHQSSISRHLSI
jgi:biotin operon repressor